MGRGNVCVTGRCEGLFYIDNDLFHVYRRDDPNDEDPETRLMDDLEYAELTGGEWYMDEVETEEEQDDIEECFMDGFTRMFRSFCRVHPNKLLKNGAYGDASRRVILESGLFYVCIEDNEWSVAIELVQKKEPYGEPWMENLQQALFEKYLDGMKKCLLDRLPRIGTYKGAWTCGELRREDVYHET